MNHNKFMGSPYSVEFQLQIEICIVQDQITNVLSCVQHFLKTSKKPAYINKLIK